MTKIGSRWHKKDCNYYSVWNVWVSTTSFWSKECWSNLSTAHGSDSQWVAVLFCVWWYLGFQSWSHLSRGLSPGGFWALPPTWLTISMVCPSVSLRSPKSNSMDTTSTALDAGPWSIKPPPSRNFLLRQTNRLSRDFWPWLTFTGNSSRTLLLSWPPSPTL